MEFIHQVVQLIAQRHQQEEVILEREDLKNQKITKSLIVTTHLIVMVEKATINLFLEERPFNLKVYLKTNRKKLQFMQKINVLDAKE